MPVHDVTIARNPDGPVRNPIRPVVIDLPGDGHEVPIAIRHPDGGVIIITMKAHRGTLTTIPPPGGVVREVEDTGEVVASWRVP